MTEYKEVHARQILNPTAIDLAEYVINPYRGCAMSCLYCYARFMKTSLRENRPWGEYVYVKINAPKVLEREIARKKPHCVLLGSTTECFQEIEKKYNLARRILEVLHKHRICYYILTRSPYIAESAALLREDLCKGVYFTVNLYHASLKEKLEPRSAPFDERLACVKALRAQGVRVIPYVSPFLPWICDVDALCARLDVFEAIEFGVSISGLAISTPSSPASRKNSLRSAINIARCAMRRGIIMMSGARRERPLRIRRQPIRSAMRYSSMHITLILKTHTRHDEL
jgi:DNA repair photolyase